MNSLIVAFFVTAGSTGAPPLPSLERALAGGAELQAAVIDRSEQVSPVDSVRPAVRRIEIAPATFAPETAAQIIA